MPWEYNNIKEYRKTLLNKRITSVDLAPEDIDEGIKITTEDGSWIKVSFNACEGYIQTYNSKEIENGKGGSKISEGSNW